MKRLDKEKVYIDISRFIYKYTHESALTYPVPEDYIELSEDMNFAKNILRITFPEGEHVRAGQTMERVIYDSGRPLGAERAYNYKVSLGGDIEVVYYLDEDFQPDEEEEKLYQWICDQVFLVYGKQQVVDVLNLVSKVRRDSGEQKTGQPDSVNN
jgi:hypothetical protein